MKGIILALISLSLLLQPVWAKTFRLLNRFDKESENLYKVIMSKQPPACLELKLLANKYKNENRKIDTSKSDFIIASEKCEPGFLGNYYKQQDFKKLIEFSLLSQYLQSTRVQEREHGPILLLDNHPDHDEILYPGIDFIPLE